jgi:twitching motility protein PilI
MTNDPFDTLVNIEQQCRRYAKSLPSQKIIGRMWQGIGFMSADKYYVVPLNEIKEILLLPALTVLPSGVGWFRGVANLRGHLLPITDLQTFIAETEEIQKTESNPTPITSLSRIIVIDFEASMVGFLVQQVFGIQRFPEELVGIETDKQDSNDFHDGKILWHRLSLISLSRLPSFNHIVKQMVT